MDHDCKIYLCMIDDKTKQQIDLHFQFNKYLNLVGLHQEQMSPIQLIETRRAFFGAVGQILVLMNEVIAPLPEDDGVQIMENLTQQCGEFWLKENNRQS